MNRDDKDKSLLIGAGGALALKGGITLHNARESRETNYKNFDELLDKYKSAKKGDVVLFKGTFSDEKIHPIMLINSEGVNSRYINLHPGGKDLISDGNLKDMLMYQTHEEGKFIPSRANISLEGLYRDPAHNPEKLDKVLEAVKVNKDKYSYNPLKFEFDIYNKKKCGQGTCVTFIDKLVRDSSDAKRARAVLPTDLIKNLEPVVKNKSRILANPSLLLTVPAIAGATMLTSEDQTTKTVGGAMALGGLGGLLYRPMRNTVNLAGGFASHSLGSQLVKDIKPGMSDLNKRTLGAAVTLPLLYFGVKKLLDKDYAIEKKAQLSALPVDISKSACVDSQFVKGIKLQRR